MEWRKGDGEPEEKGAVSEDRHNDGTMASKGMQDSTGTNEFRTGQSGEIWKRFNKGKEEWGKSTFLTISSERLSISIIS